MRNRYLLLLIGPILPLLLVVSACSGDDNDGSSSSTAPSPSPAVTATRAASAPSQPTPTIPPAPGIFDKEKATTTPSGLMYIDTVVGSGASPQPTQTVLVNYTGKLANGGRVFDSTAGKSPIAFPLNRVIRGFSEGIQTMQPGGKRTIYIPAALAYGANPPPGSGIPANADLVFDIELISVQ